MVSRLWNRFDRDGSGQQGHSNHTPLQPPRYPGLVPNDCFVDCHTDHPEHMGRDSAICRRFPTGLPTDGITSLSLVNSTVTLVCPHGPFRTVFAWSVDGPHVRVSPSCLVIPYSVLRRSTLLFVMLGERYILHKTHSYAIIASVHVMMAGWLPPSCGGFRRIGRFSGRSCL